MPVPGLMMIFWVAGLSGLLIWLVCRVGSLPGGFAAFFVAWRRESAEREVFGSWWVGRGGDPLGLVVMMRVMARRSGTCGVLAYRRKGKAGTWGIRSS